METTQAISTPAPQPRSDEVRFPSLDWFRRLAEEMRSNRARHEHLGDVDCVAQFTVLDAGPSGVPWSAQVTFEEFDVIDVRPASDLSRADFVLEGNLATWRGMIENIAEGDGRPDLTHTLNYLTLPNTPMRAWSDDPVRRDFFFRFNQSFQEFFNASSAFRTAFPGE